jgi:single-stranded-DNA-specific exonuclease
VLHPLLDLVAVGTVCDVMPLIDENRIFVRWGLKRARETKNIGLSALFDRIGLTAEKINERAFGFSVGPRINAAGRIDETSKALDLLMSDNWTDARHRADEIEEINTKRRELTGILEVEAVAQARDQVARFPDRQIVSIFSPTSGDLKAWHPGLMGIVAAKTVEAVKRGVFAFAVDAKEGGWKGSGRGLPGSDIHLHGALKDVSQSTDLIAKYGGHAEAAGASLRGGEGVPEKFAAMIADAAERQQPALAFGGEREKETGQQPVEAEVKLADLNTDFVKLLSFFGPFGAGNPQIGFWARDCEITDTQVFGSRGSEKLNHIKFTVHQGDHQMEAVGWGLAEKLAWLQQADKPVRAHLAFNVAENVFRDKKSVRMDLLDAVASVRTLDVEASPPTAKPETRHKATPKKDGGFRATALEETIFLGAEILLQPKTEHHDTEGTVDPTTKKRPAGRKP